MKRKNSSQLQEHEITTVLLYQQKMAYFQNLLNQETDDMLRERGLDPAECSIDMPSGKITKSRR